MWKIERVENSPHQYGPGEVCFIVNSNSYVVTQRQLPAMMQAVEFFQRGDIGTAMSFFKIAIKLSIPGSDSEEWRELERYVAGRAVSSDVAGVDPEWDTISAGEALAQIDALR